RALPDATPGRIVMKNRLGGIALLVVGCAAVMVCVALAQSGAQATAEITVIVPAQAEVFFDGAPTTQKGVERRFVTAPLTAGQKYYYSVVARWREGNSLVESSRKVEFSRDASIRVDFLATPPADVAQAGRTTQAAYPPTKAFAQDDAKPRVTPT